jgi:hypothetical protein
MTQLVVMRFVSEKQGQNIAFGNAVSFGGRSMTAGALALRSW